MVSNGASTSDSGSRPLTGKPLSIDPNDSAPLILFGRVVPMDGRVIDDGAVYCRNGIIQAVQARGAVPPDGFNDAVRMETNGVIYPGLLDLHNHLNYNVLTLWDVPKKYGDRYEWRTSSEYHRDISQPMSAIVAKGLSAAVIRYVEAKLLVGGTTSAQGMSLKSGDAPFYRGLIRNFERTEDSRLPEITTQLEDIFKLAQPDIDAMKSELDAGTRLFHHLAEGRNARAHQAFVDVQQRGFLRPNYVGIHDLGLTDAEYAQLCNAGAKAVWSPTSNSLLYGQTIDIPQFFDSGIPWGLGCDWSPSGTKNQLGEMKVALLAARAAGKDIDYRRLCEAVATQAASIVGWENSVGSIAPNLFADLLVLRSKSSDPYGNLVLGTEKDIMLVVIAGVPRYGDAPLMDQSGLPAGKLEMKIVAGGSRKFFFEHPASPINSLSLADAITNLENGMADLTNIPPPPSQLFRALGFDQDELQLDLEMDLEPGTRLLDASARNFTGPFKPPLVPALKSVPLDKLTIDDDPQFFDHIDAVAAAPPFLRELRTFY
jgi:cytosine/adenosine deaminase-related metal-dependent hydrolase